MEERLREALALAVNTVSQTTNELLSSWRVGKLA
jgi:hypothetical protein